VTILGPAERLTIFVEQTDRLGRNPLFTEIVRKAREAGLAGATVLHGVEGFGASSRVHAPAAIHVSEDVPVVIVIVDDHDRIGAFLTVIEELVSGGLVVRQPVEVVIHRARR
jgi:uncharacterized protein